MKHRHPDRPDMHVPYLCELNDKRGYWTRGQANAARRENERKFHIRFAVYKCEHCIGYHLTKLKNGIKYRGTKTGTKNQTGSKTRGRTGNDRSVPGDQ